MSIPPAPQIDVESKPFWDAAREHRLEIQQCSECGKFRFPPNPVCAACRSLQFTWQQIGERAHVRSWVRTHVVAHPYFGERTPYVTLFVELAEHPGLVMYGNPRFPVDDVYDGMPVRATFEDYPEFTLVNWEPVRS